MEQYTYKNISVNWSPDIKALADTLLRKWKRVRSKEADPFAKTCIVVNDAFTEKWLKDYYLLERRIPQIMMDLEFVRLPEFVNDWLFATIHQKTPRGRSANQHPYSKNVMAWRIYNILKNADPDGEFKELLNYVDKNKGKCAEKRYALSVMLANLYDSYL
ncbi:MAG: exodeoxyribonuclease V subunit gamma, partial [Victivallales bacterium]|nr:exodeoxyribonuclease V subunit gamma [Victivallales bacterium]